MTQTRRPVERERRQPVRTCVACRTAGGKRGLVRVVRLGAGEAAGSVVIDPSGKMSGRGAYVCPTVQCISAALKQKKLERSLKTPIGDDVAATLHRLAEASDAERHIEAPSGESASG